MKLLQLGWWDSTGLHHAFVTIIKPLPPAPAVVVNLGPKNERGRVSRSMALCSFESAVL